MDLRHLRLSACVARSAPVGSGEADAARGAAAIMSAVVSGVAGRGATCSAGASSRESSSRAWDASSFTCASASARTVARSIRYVWLPGFERKATSSGRHDVGGCGCGGGRLGLRCGQSDASDLARQGLRERGVHGLDRDPCLRLQVDCREELRHPACAHQPRDLEARGARRMRSHLTVVNSPRRVEPPRAATRAFFGGCGERVPDSPPHGGEFAIS